MVVAGLALAAATCNAALARIAVPDGGGAIPQIYATRPPSLFYHTAGALRLMVTNMGILGNPQLGVDSYGAGWRGGEYLRTAELWVGAVAGDNLEHVSTGLEFRPSLDPRDTIYLTHEGAPGGSRLGFAPDGGDDDGDGRRDEDFLNGKDDDGDGRVDEDFEAIGQEMFSCEYWDDTQESLDTMLDHRPLHLKVRQRTFAWSEERYDSCIGIDLEIINEGFETLRNVYVGWLVDGDVGRGDALGYWRDDLGVTAHVDTTFLEESITYRCQDRLHQWHDCRPSSISFDIACMRDAKGAEGGQYGDDQEGENDGWLGFILLDHTTDEDGERAPRSVRLHTRRYITQRWSYELLDLTRYQWLSSGQWLPDTTALPSDYALLASIGPFPELLPGEVIRSQWMLLVGPGWLGLRENAFFAMRVYEGEWRDTDFDPETGSEGREKCLHVEADGRPIVWRDPCVELGDTRKVKVDDCTNPDNWVDDDCNCCTPVQDPRLDEWGRDTIVKWIGRIGPPPPNTSTMDAQKQARLVGDRRVVIEWDNTPELVYIPSDSGAVFSGYRIWRVEGWTRPLGSPGPDAAQWERIADLAVDPVGSQQPLAEHTNPMARILEYVTSPVDPHVQLPRYEVGRYAYEDRSGLKNGMLYFYDVTSFATWIDQYGRPQEIGQPPAALEAEAVRPHCEAIAGSGWKDLVAVVPNPYRGGAAWDLCPNAADPLGTHISFIGLPDRECDIRVYTLAGDLVKTLHHEPWNGRGEVSWDLISRNHQQIVSGIYLYAVTCGDETVVGRFTVIL
jgi:hypothetical protein